MFIILAHDDANPTLNQNVPMGKCGRMLPPETESRAMMSYGNYINLDRLGGSQVVVGSILDLSPEDAFAQVLFCEGD